MFYLFKQQISTAVPHNATESESGMELPALHLPVITVIHGGDGHSDENQEILNASKPRTRAVHKRASLQGGPDHQQQRRPSKTNLKFKRSKNETDHNDDELDGDENRIVIVKELETVQTA